MKAGMKRRWPEGSRAIEDRAGIIGIRFRGGGSGLQTAKRYLAYVERACTYRRGTRMMSHPRRRGLGSGRMRGVDGAVCRSHNEMVCVGGCRGYEVVLRVVEGL